MSSPHPSSVSPAGSPSSRYPSTAPRTQFHKSGDSLPRPPFAPQYPHLFFKGLGVSPTKGFHPIPQTPLLGDSRSPRISPTPTRTPLCFVSLPRLARASAIPGVEVWVGGWVGEKPSGGCPAPGGPPCTPDLPGPREGPRSSSPAAARSPVAVVYQDTRFLTVTQAASSPSLRGGGAGARLGRRPISAHFRSDTAL